MNAGYNSHPAFKDGPFACSFPGRIVLQAAHRSTILDAGARETAQCTKADNSLGQSLVSTWWCHPAS